MNAHFVISREMTSNSGKSYVISLLSLTGTRIKVCVFWLVGCFLPTEHVTYKNQIRSCVRKCNSRSAPLV